MAKYDSLFQLIRSMTKAEKRFFKLNSTRYEKEDKDYLRLFDAIVGQKVYNEDAIRKKFKDEPYYEQLGVLKAYLRGQIIKALKNFHDNSSPDIKLQNYLMEVEILFKRGLTADCLDIIKKAKIHARKYENFPALLNLVSWETKVLLSNSNDVRFDLFNVQCKEEVREALGKYKELHAIRQIECELRSFTVKNGTASIEKERQFVLDILSDKHMEQQAMSFEAELIRLKCRGKCFDILDYRQETFDAAKKCVEFFELHPDRIDANCDTYFLFLNTLLDIAITSKRFNFSENLVRKIKAFDEARRRKLGLKINKHTMILEIYLLAEQGELARATDVVSQLVAMNSGAKEVNPLDEIYCYHCYASTYFKKGDYRNSLYYINNIININLPLYRNLHSIARMVNLIVQYELGEYEHLGYALRSAYRFLMKKEQLVPPEDVFLDFIRRVTRLNSREQLLREFSNLKEALLPYRDHYFICDFSIIEWIDSKIQQRSLADVIRENYAVWLEKEKAGAEVSVYP